MPKPEPVAPYVPRQLVVAPFFAATKQTEPRELKIDGRRWVVGIAHPTKRRESPALDMRHARACFALLSFRDRLRNDKEIYFSMNEFCRRYAHSQGGRFARDVLNILYDLQDTFVAREIDDDTIEYFQIVNEIRIHQKATRRRDALKALSMQSEMWLDCVSLSPEFFGLMKRWEELARIRLDVLNGLKSSKAQAIYTYIPSRAVHHTRSDPFTITLANVLEQIGAPIPNHKSKRKEIFTQNENSILSQLDRSEIANGGKLRVEIVETRDKSDYKLVFWVEQGDPEKAMKSAAKQSKMLDAWLKGGRTQSLFQERLKGSKRLDYYKIENLEKAGVNLANTERFFEMANALLGDASFDRILSEGKGDALEGNGGTNPTGRMIYRLLNAIEMG